MTREEIYEKAQEQKKTSFTHMHWRSVIEKSIEEIITAYPTPRDSFYAMAQIAINLDISKNVNEFIEQISNQFYDGKPIPDAD